MSEYNQLSEALNQPMIIEYLDDINIIDSNNNAELHVVIREEDYSDINYLDVSTVLDDKEVLDDGNGLNQPVLENAKPKKVKRDEKNWIVNQRKRKFQAGEEFINYRGKTRPSKALINSKKCLVACKYKCATFISESERGTIFKEYYKMNQHSKYNFIAATSEKLLKKRATTKGSQSRRVFTFRYFFNIGCDRITVCKKFYLTTLAISQKPVYTVHNKKNHIIGSASESVRGKKKTKKVSDNLRDKVIDHIASFPAVESHYCRLKTNKRYLESNLNIAKMYDLYVTLCNEANTSHVKQSFYRYIFNTQFNIDFHKPKSDRCGVCELYKTNKDQLKEGQYEEHISLKQAMRILKENDKKSDIPILCFDLENVITCPKSEIGEVFYHSKLNFYNLTAHLSTSKSVYCAVWSEYTGGRSGNDIASALIKILERIFENNDFNKLIMWSDSCVPQNKNSHMAYAIKWFLAQHPNIESIEMRYSLPGHSAIQEVDHAHSEIEKTLSRNEFFSPIGALRLLKNINRRRPYTILQMQPGDFKDYASSSKMFNFKAVPFASVRMIKYSQEIPTIQFNLTYIIERYIEVNLRPLIKSTRRKQTPMNNSFALVDPRTVSPDREIPHAKCEHLRSMFKYMSQQDIDYYKTILKMNAPSTSVQIIPGPD